MLSGGIKESVSADISLGRAPSLQVPRLWRGAEGHTAGVRRGLDSNVVGDLKVGLLSLTLNCLGPEWLLVHMPLGEAG